jgi:hypothetical protein
MVYSLTEARLTLGGFSYVHSSLAAMQTEHFPLPVFGPSHLAIAGWDERS